MTVENGVPRASGNPEESRESREPNSRYTFIEVVNVLTSFRHNHERMKLFRVSLSVLRFLSILNFIYTILGVTFLMLAMCTEWTPEFNAQQRHQFFRIGLTVSVFAPLASFVDMLALRGLHTWRRSLLLPWLFLYAFAVSLILANSLAGLFHHGFKWTYMVLMVCSLCLYSAWRHIRAQYAEMARERPTCRTIEELAQDIRETTNNNNFNPGPANDLPPKYEDLEQPPIYTEETSQALNNQQQDQEFNQLPTFEAATRNLPVDDNNLPVSDEPSSTNNRPVLKNSV